MFDRLPALFRGDLAGVVLVLAMGAASLAIAWIGYQGWALDDYHFLTAAENWVKDGRYLGRTHWELRHGFVLPLAASIATFGSTELALLAVPVAFYILLLLVTYFFVRSLFGRTEAVFAGVLAASLPLLAAWATTPRDAIAEALYLALGFWLFIQAASNAQGRGLALFLAGIAFGFAWLTRETVAGLALMFLVLFVARWPLERGYYRWLAIGAAVVILGEFLFYYACIGNPFYRLLIDLNHGAITSGGGDGEVAAAVARTASDDSLRSSLWDLVARFVQHFDWSRIDSQKPVALLHINNRVDPYVQFFTEPYFGLAFWLGLPALIFLSFSRKQSRHLALFGKLALLTAAFFVAFSLYILFLRPLPRYFLFPAYLAVVAIGIVIGQYWRTGRRPIVIAAFIFILTIHGIMMDTRRGLGLYNERQLIAYAETISEPVYTDASTYEMASFLIREHRLEDHIRIGVLPPPGGLFFQPGSRTQDDENKGGFNDVARADWPVVYEHHASKKVLALLLDAVGASKLLPEYAYLRLADPYGTARIYRAPSD